MADQADPAGLLATLAAEHADVERALAKFTAGPHVQPYTQTMAAGLIVVIPLVIVVLLCQRRIVSGLTAGGVKG